MPGLSDEFQRILGQFGFEWDGIVDFQSNRTEAYRESWTALARRGRAYPCRCSRSQLAATVGADPGTEPVYPGTCRSDPDAGKAAHALRFAIESGAAPVEFEDAFQGLCVQDCRTEAGDFVIRRRDGHAAYHLAVVVDDAHSGVTEVVRGADLLSSTPRQILLHRALDLPTPRYGHLPLLTESGGQKLAKSRHAVPLAQQAAPRQLWQVLEWLEQSPPPELATAPVRQIWDWAVPNWRPERLAGIRERRLPPADPV